MHLTDSVLPFLEKAPCIRLHTRPFKTEAIFVNPDWNNLTENQDEEPHGYCPVKYQGILVKPLNIVILDALPNDIFTLKQTYTGVDVEVTEVDYKQVADIIEKGEEEAYYPSITGYFSCAISSYEYVDYAIQNQSISELDYPPVEGREALESFESYIPVRDRVDEVIDINALNGMSKKVKTTTQNPFLNTLESYFTGQAKYNRIPLLIGKTAVAKSALVKSLADKYGMRLVDLRTAFMSHLDLKGLTEIKENDITGKMESYSCILDSMVSVTDSYLDYCAKAVELINKQLETETDEKVIASLKNSLPDFVEGAKTPVLLLDEFTRCEASIRKMFTNILTDKRFDAYKMERAVLIAATNSSGADAEIEYNTHNDTGDGAFNDRFTSLFITPESVTDNWDRWANKTKDGTLDTNLHKDILSFLNEYPDYKYNDSFVVEAFAINQDEYSPGSTPFPNFRTWEMVSDIMYKNRDNKTLDRQYISGLIGKATTDEFFQFLSENTEWKEAPEKVGDEDTLTKMVRLGMKTNTPTLLIGPSSIGKTSRVKQYVKEHDAVFIPVNLSEQDRTDLTGTPCKQNLANYVSKNAEGLPDKLISQLVSYTDDLKLPPKISVRAPDKKISEKFEQAVRDNREIVIFFDEINRVQNASVMSSVFDCISDHRLFGVTFDPRNVSIFAACNMGENAQDTMALDPAFAARFAVYKQEGYTEEDAQAFLKYAESSDFDPILLDYLKGIGTDKLLDIIKSVETRTLEKSAASTRGFEDLSTFLKDRDNNNAVSGAILFPNTNDSADIQNAYKNKSSMVDLFNNNISPCIDNWACVLDPDFVAHLELRKNDGSGNTYNLDATSEEIVDLYKQGMSAINEDLKSGMEISDDTFDKLSNILTILRQADKDTKSERFKTITNFLGDNTEEFLSFYNTKSGRGLVHIKVEDLRNEKLLDPFMRQELATDAANEISSLASEMLKAIYKEFGNNKQADFYHTVISKVFDKNPSVDGKYEFVKGYTIGGTSIDELNKYCESNLGVQFAQWVIETIGMTYDPSLEYDGEDSFTLKQED